MLSDGSAYGRPPTNNAEEPLPDQVRRYLISLPDDQVPIPYGKLARALEHLAPGSIAKITNSLEVTMHEDAASGVPFIAARAVSRGVDKLPGRGFFDLACALGKGPREGESDRSFHSRQLDEVTLLIDSTRGSASG